MTQHLLPDLPGFSIEQITLVGDMITLIAQSQTRSASCPDCASVSSRVHSRYSRQLVDLPWSGRKVRLILQVRRFFCGKFACPRKTFAEAIPAIAERYARRTSRQKQLLVQLGLALGGEAGASVTRALSMPCSPDTDAPAMSVASL
jgi:transposase